MSEHAGSKETSERRCRLRGQVGAQERTFLLAPGENRVGSSDANDLVLPVPGVSRNHAVLRDGAAGLELEDLASRNGSFVDGTPVRRAPVRPGDVLRFGPVELQLEEIDAGDAELAVVLGGSAAEPPPLSPEESTVALREAPWAPASLWPPELVFPPGYLPGRSAAMGRCYHEMRPLLAADLPVLIEGETGVGKELVAQTLHLSSARRGEPFVAVNCAAIPADLLESEMFGIGEGVATGVKKRRGKFQDAQGGTLFLDEIGEMPRELQVKLLRALQEKEVQAVGGTAMPVDVWVITATNLDLRQRVEEDHFRRDLYYRVAGSVLRLPPLRRRGGDILPLVEHFLRRAAAEIGRSVRGMTVKALAALEGYPWPGNVRELEHEVRRLAHLCGDGRAIDSTMLPRRLLHPAAGAPAGGEGSLKLEDHVQEAERRAILQALERAGGSQRGASRLLGISRNTLARKIRALGIPT